MTDEVYIVFHHAGQFYSWPRQGTPKCEPVRGDRFILTTKEDSEDVNRLRRLLNEKPELWDVFRHNSYIDRETGKLVVVVK